MDVFISSLLRLTQVRWLGVEGGWRILSHIFLLTLVSLLSNMCSATLSLLQCLKYAKLSLIQIAHVLLLLMSSATFIPSSHIHYVIDNTDPHTFCQSNFCINSKEAYKGDLLYFRKIPLTILFQTWRFSSTLIIPKMYQGLMTIWWMRENWNESMNKIWIHGWIDEQEKDGWAHKWGNGIWHFCPLHPHKSEASFPQLLWVQHAGQASSCPSSHVKETHLLFKIKSYFELPEVRVSKAAA